jgi:hypothetical protein
MTDKTVEGAQASNFLDFGLKYNGMNHFIGKIY